LKILHEISNLKSSVNSFSDWLSNPINQIH
jgi:hypothetical protein